MIDPATPSNRRFNVGLVGLEREPLLLVERMLPDPERLVRSAENLTFAPAFTAAGGYPGHRAPAPRAYVDFMVQALAMPIAKAFGLGSIRPVKADCAFSIVTLSSKDLAPSQRAPHVDTTNGWQFAILHYLCDSSFGGTSFYRHRATGFETITPERQPNYLAVRHSESATDGYVEDGAPWFERTASIDARFDRVIVYRSRILHSGHISNAARLSAHPRTGRLTANIFATFEPVL
jgi:hypothetical protein